LMATGDAWPLTRNGTTPRLTRAITGRTFNMGSPRRRVAADVERVALAGSGIMGSDMEE